MAMAMATRMAMQATATREGTEMATRMAMEMEAMQEAGEEA